MKKTILIVLLLSFGFSQKLVHTTGYDNGNIKDIYYHKKTRTGIEKVKYEGYYQSGQKSGEGTYKDGEPEGLWTYYTEVGDGKYSVTYAVGTYNTTMFTDNLGTDYTGLTITDEPEQDGTYLFQKFSKYDFSKYPMLFFTYKDKEKYGLWTKWYEDGQKEYEKTYKERRTQEGLSTYWYENGQKKREGTFKDDRKDGLWTWWNKNGQKEKEETYKDRIKYGLKTVWYKNGQKEAEDTYKYGKKDGLTTGWYENGQKEWEGTYKDGKEDGKWTWWYENGKKSGENTLKDGELISEECWDKDGIEKECD